MGGSSNFNGEALYQASPMRDGALSPFYSDSLSDEHFDNHSLALESMGSFAFGFGAVCTAPQQYETPLYPRGCIFKIVVLSTWGDPFYVGLNGLELYDQFNLKLDLHEQNLQAEPRDLNVLPEYASLPPERQDPRTLDKLYDGVNATYDDDHMSRPLPFSYPLFHHMSRPLSFLYPLFHHMSRPLPFSYPLFHHIPSPPNHVTLRSAPTFQLVVHLSTGPALIFCCVSAS